VTREQIIVLGFIVAAFVAGWVVRALMAWWDRERGAAQAELAGMAQGTPGPAPGSPATEPPDPSAEAPLAKEVGDALRRDAPNESMLSVVSSGDEAALTEVELDLTDWGFTYGVAWARARERSPEAPDEAIADEALRAAESVFRAYTGDGDWTRRLDERHPQREGESNGHSAPSVEEPSQSGERPT
jgi:hypothetical protein